MMGKWRLEDKALDVVIETASCYYISIKKGYLKYTEYYEGFDVPKDQWENLDEIIFVYDKKIKSITTDEATFTNGNTTIRKSIHWFLNHKVFKREIENVIKNKKTHKNAKSEMNVHFKESELNASYLIYTSEYDMLLREIDRALDNKDIKMLEILRKEVSKIDELQNA